jgi:outer membrane protein assembly factor BamB
MKHITDLALLICAATAASAGNWPAWRGPEGTGLSSEAQLPEAWGTNQNVRWQIALPGPGNSSPVVWGSRVFVSQYVKAEQRRTVMCFNRADGKLLWQSGAVYTEDEPTQPSNPYCGGTPVTDGQRVIASFGSAGLYCFDMEGKELWHRDLGKLNHMFGSAASPVLYQDLCFLNFGPDRKARLVALDKRDGKTAWEAEPPKVDPSEQQPMRGGPGGHGGPGGRGGFGPGMMIAPQIFSQAHKNEGQKLSREEFVGLADAWFDKLDPDKTGKVTQAQFAERLPEVLPPPEGAGPPGGGPPEDGPPPGGGRGGFGPARFIGPGLFALADGDKDGRLTREELKATFGAWFNQWDSAKSGSLSEEQVRDGLNAALPRPGSGGGPGDPPSGGRGPGGLGGGESGPSGSWSTPIIVKAGQRDELVVNFPNRLVAYNPESGAQLWMSKGLGGSIYTTPLWGDETVVAMSSDMGGGSAIALKPGGHGDVTEAQRIWRQERIKAAIGSGVIYEGRLYLIGQDGVVTCLELKTGNKLWEERLKGPGSKSGSWSSMLVARGKIYVPNQSGDVFILRAGPQFEVLATNSVHEPTNASLAASDGDLFMRTDKSLWCFAAPKL